MNRSCIRFREALTPGARDPHRDSCPTCDTFARAVETAAAARLDAPPSAGLLDRLRAIPEDEERRRCSVDAVPELPLPEALRERLRGIPAEQNRPPSWIRRPGYTVAASYLLTVLIGTALGNPATFAREKALPLTTDLADSLSAGVEQQARTTLTGAETTLTNAGNEARERLDRLGESAGTTFRASKALLISSLDTTNRKIKELAGTILPDDEPEEREAASEPPSAKGDKDE